MKETKKTLKIYIYIKKIFEANVAFWAQELHFLNFTQIKDQRGTRKSC